MIATIETLELEPIALVNSVVGVIPAGQSPDVMRQHVLGDVPRRDTGRHARSNEVPVIVLHLVRPAVLAAAALGLPGDRPDTVPVHHHLIAEGHQLVRDHLAAGVAPGRYQILAAINAVHTSARHRHVVPD